MEFTTKEINILANTIVDIGENLKHNPLKGRSDKENEIYYNQQKRWIYELYMTFKQIEKSRENLIIGFDISDCLDKTCIIEGNVGPNKTYIINKVDYE